MYIDKEIARRKVGRAKKKEKWAKKPVITVHRYRL